MNLEVEGSSPSSATRKEVEMEYIVKVIQTLKTFYKVDASNRDEAIDKVLQGEGVEEISYSNDMDYDAHTEEGGE